jgi:hypothetical protein
LLVPYKHACMIHPVGREVLRPKLKTAMFNNT